ncbi:MAG: minC [Gammaproteobacteria bacterium]|jgi:septum site-determining protein MinC|nr:minC [Gammaproteobacteria bacterium]
MITSSARVEKACLQFKASFLPITVLQITCYDWEGIEQQLLDTVHNAPPFFINLPVIIDLDKIKTLGTLNFIKLKEILLTNKMTLIGIRGGSDEQHLAAAMVGLPILIAGKSSAPEAVQQPKQKEDSAVRLTKLVTTPIRSGMQVYAKESDLIVTAAVSQGAELLADGNIHIYGPLRGRVLAGVQGNLQSRIFCRALDAELVSIAGYYLTKEDMLQSPTGDGMRQIYLENEQIRIEIL